jgi:molecular chaperone IbpA
MTHIDFTPLFRNAIGFDRMTRLLDVAQDAAAAGFPPYNIEKLGDDAFRLTLAVAGFGPSDVDITVERNVLTVVGKSEPAKDRAFLFRGIAGRSFERRIALADHIVVKGASLENGLLHVDLAREVPEAHKPRRIEIGTSGPRAIGGEPDAGLAKAA